MGAPAPQGSPKIRFFEREAPLGYALVLPAALYLALFIAYPFLMSIFLSLSDAQAGNKKWSYIGTANYSKVQSYDLLANDFVIATFPSAEEARAFIAQKPSGKVETAPAAGSASRREARGRRPLDSHPRDGKGGRRLVRRVDRAPGHRLGGPPRLGEEMGGGRAREGGADHARLLHEEKRPRKGAEGAARPRKDGGPGPWNRRPAGPEFPPRAEEHVQVHVRHGDPQAPDRRPVRAAPEPAFRGPAADARASS